MMNMKYGGANKPIKEGHTNHKLRTHDTYIKEGKQNKIITLNKKANINTLTKQNCQTNHQIIDQSNKSMKQTNKFK